MTKIVPGPNRLLIKSESEEYEFPYSAEFMGYNQAESTKRRLASAKVIEVHPGSKFKVGSTVVFNPYGFFKITSAKERIDLINEDCILFEVQS